MATTTPDSKESVTDAAANEAAAQLEALASAIGPLIVNAGDEASMRLQRAADRISEVSKGALGSLVLEYGLD